MEKNKMTEQTKRKSAAVRYFTNCGNLRRCSVLLEGMIRSLVLPGSFSNKHLSAQLDDLIKTLSSFNNIQWDYSKSRFPLKNGRKDRTVTTVRKDDTDETI